MLELCTVWCALKSATTYEPPAWTDHYASLPKGGVADQCYWYGCQWVLGLEDGSGLGHEHNMADKWFDDVESDECVLHADLESFVTNVQCVFVPDSVREISILFRE